MLESYTSVVLDDIDIYYDTPMQSLMTIDKNNIN